ncbi:MAG: exopolyphosphatase [Pseudomonadales bacterium]|nr:exopolyphosphatase [Pseudomonadales bacterium]
MAASYRLITRGDFDGVVCAALLRSSGHVDDVSFAHPKDVQDGLVPVAGDVILANLPYVAGAYMVFDHHSSELERNAAGTEGIYVNDPDAPSAARVIFEYFGGAEGFPDIDPQLLEAVDRADSADFSRMDILEPTHWPLLAFVLDARTGLGRFRDFRAPNMALLEKMIDMVRTQSIEEILRDRDVSERIRLYFEQEIYFRQQLERCTRLSGDVAVVDLRAEDPIYAGNRFMVYALFPEVRVSVHCLRGLGATTVFAVGKSILDRSSPVNVGHVCLTHGGGGHTAAGTCQVPDAEAEATLGALLDALRGN